MATLALPAIDPAYGTDLTQKAKVRRIDFGDGFSQRKRHGLNSVRQKWNIVWENIPDADAETLRLFFAGQAGVELILWTPFGQATQLKWTDAGDFRSRPSGFGISNCSVTIEQEFDL